MYKYRLNNKNKTAYNGNKQKSQQNYADFFVFIKILSFQDQKP